MNKFLKMMSQNDSRALQARASQINTTGEIAQKSIIQELKNKKAKLEIAIQDLTDFAPDTTQSLRPGCKNWDPDKWARDLHSLKVERYGVNVGLEIAEDTYDEFFKSDDAEDTDAAE